MIKKIVHKLCDNPVISNFIRNVIEAGMITVRRNIRKEIGDTRNKRIIDIACGTGEFSRLAEGEYVGVDLDKRHIKYASRKYGTPKKKFFVKDASRLGGPDKCFDYAFMLSFLHHTAEKDIEKVLKEAMRVTKNKIIIVDLVPLKYNLIGKFFYNLDQGKYIRPFDKQLRLVKKYAKVRKSRIFRSGMDLHSLIVVEPKKVISQA